MAPIVENDSANYVAPIVETNDTQKRLVKAFSVPTQWEQINLPKSEKNGSPFIEDLKKCLIFFLNNMQFHVILYLFIYLST